MSAAPALPETPAQTQAAVSQGVHRQFVISKSALHGAQYASLGATPAYLLYAWRRHRFTLRGLVCANWVVPLTGSLAAGAYAAQISATADPQATLAHATAMRQNAASIKAEDYYVIGGVVGALAIPAIFLKRVGVVNGILGGVGMGGGLGLAWDWLEDALQTRKTNLLVKKTEDALSAPPPGPVPPPVPSA